MIPATTKLPRDANLELLLTRQIQEKTWGRVTNLEVTVQSEQVRVHGYTSSYYNKQLALHAVMEVLGHEPARTVSLEIEVARSTPRPR